MIEWPPLDQRLRAALWRAEGHLERGEYVAASRTLADVFELAGEEERGLVRGLFHLAAAGYKGQTGEAPRAARQLAHARRRLAPFLPAYREVDLAALLEAVEAGLRR